MSASFSAALGDHRTFHPGTQGHTIKLALDKGS